MGFRAWVSQHTRSRTEPASPQSVIEWWCPAGRPVHRPSRPGATGRRRRRTARHENGRLVVHEDSPITSLSDLAGKRVALGHGSGQTTLLLFALDRAGLSWKDIEPVDAYGDAAQLFLDREVDAWVGSYPSLTRVERESSIRGLVATDGLFSHRSLWFTRRDFAERHPEELAAIVAALQESDAWIQQNHRAAAELFAADDGGDVDAWEHALRTRPFGLHPVSEDFVAEQQRAADLFHASGLIDRKISVSEAVLPEINRLVDPTQADYPDEAGRL
ncbi:ABC transporter substrate-binding protein [Sphaerisporangium perillae]|uniref:ABC transporter substrate-binding protein n=1 Tax=Sphaerisporangium perillae TaxID=2935860 RepID=UPI002435B157|nr:ABC transporter substrate-binding protein [Sphaerisporangium perillae]